MKRKHLFLAIAALLAAGGLWLARSSSRSDDSAVQKSAADSAFKNPSDNPISPQMTNPAPQLAPPDPTRVFREFTPEQRVEFARKGHGPGG